MRSPKMLQRASATGTGATVLLGYYRVDKGAATRWEGLCTSLKVV
jgi:hypothetical protein